MYVEKAMSELVEIEYFSRCGEKTSLFADWKVDWASSWRSALEFRGTLNSTNAFLDAGNYLSSSLSLNHREAYRRWNELTLSHDELLGRRVFPVVFARIDASLDDSLNHYRDYLKSWVCSDLNSFLMECAYADLVEPRFYTLMMQVYKAGHFPCDWNEEWPRGHLRIY